MNQNQNLENVVHEERLSLALSDKKGTEERRLSSTIVTTNKEEKARIKKMVELKQENARLLEDQTELDERLSSTIATTNKEKKARIKQIVELVKRIERQEKHAHRLDSAVKQRTNEVKQENASLVEHNTALRQENDALKKKERERDGGDGGDGGDGTVGTGSVTSNTTAVVARGSARKSTTPATQRKQPHADEVSCLNDFFRQSAIELWELVPTVLTCAVVRNELSECFEVVEMDDASGGSTQNELLSECFNKFMQRHEVFKWSSTSSFVVERNGDQLFEVVEIDEIDLFE